MTQYANQYSQNTEKGQLDLAVQPNVMSTFLSGSDAVAGQALKIIDDASPMIKATAMTADTDKPFGVVVRNLKGAPSAGEMIELARNGSVITVEAGAAIARGADVEYDVSEVKVITAAGTNQVLGVALDKAAADGDLIRVEVGIRPYV